MRYAAIGMGRPIRNASDSSLRTPPPAPVASERTAPTPRFVEAGPIEPPAVPVERRPLLLARQIKDRLQRIHEAVRPAYTLGRTAPGPPTKTGHSTSGSPPPPLCPHFVRIAAPMM